MLYPRLVWAVCLACATFGWRINAQSFTWDELYRIDMLPKFKESISVGSVSSYDRTGGNDDGFSGKYSFVRKEPEGLVLADLKGPGVIYRIWTPTPTDDVLEFLFDGETKPRIEVPFRGLFLGSHPFFPRPLVGFGGGGYYSYIPIPFKKSCIVRMRALKVQFYQINYAIYPPGTPIETFKSGLTTNEEAARARASELWRRPGATLSRAATPAGMTPQTARQDVTLAPGSTTQIFHSEQGGRIVGLRIGPASAIISKARDLTLRIAFDEESPAVHCPLGDFFGYGWGEPAMQSLLVGTDGETNYCYLPMPYTKKVTLEIISERSVPVQLHAEVDHAPVPKSTSEGTFYAVWRRQNPTIPGEPYEYVAANGRGHLVGVVLQAQGFESGKTLFFEGDDETAIDGETVIHGTGSEDFFNGGWYDVPDRWDKRISFPLSGCLTYAKHLGRTGGYRFFLGDAYSYHQTFRQTMEHGGEKNAIPTDYSSVSYLYADRPPAGINDRPTRDLRKVNDLAEVIFPAWWQLPIEAWSFEHATLARQKEKIGNEEVRYLSLNASGEDWFGLHFLEPVVDVPANGEYSIYIEAIKGPAQSKVQLFQDENPIAPPADLQADARSKSGRVFLGKLILREGRNRVMLKLPKSESSKGEVHLDIISLICVRTETK